MADQQSPVPWVCPWGICNHEQAQECRANTGYMKRRGWISIPSGCGSKFRPGTTPEQAREMIEPPSAAGVALPIPTFEQVMEIAGKHDTEKNAGLMAFARELLSTYGVKEVPRG